MTFEATFSIITVPRKDINLKHNLLDILFLVVTAILSNAEGWVDIEEFGKTKEDWLKKYRPFKNGIPLHDTIARVISILDPETLNLKPMLYKLGKPNKTTPRLTNNSHRR